MKQVLVWHQGALGDLILSLSAIREVRLNHPHGLIHLICRADLRDIIMFNGLADRVSSHEDGRLAAIFNGPSEFTSDYMRGYETAYVFARSGGVLLETIRSHVPETVWVSTIPPAGFRVHAGLYQLRQISGKGAADAAEGFSTLKWPAISPVPGDAEVICVHPGSGARGKCWPVDRYISMIKQFDRSGYAFKIFQGPAEDEGYAGQIEAVSTGSKIRAEVIRHRPLSEVASHLKSAVCYIGNDSGITHLAAALGVPAVAIFGPTDHLVWRPRGDVISVVASDASCAPCGEEYRGCHSGVCMKGISVRKVASAVASVLQRRRFKGLSAS